MERNALQTKFLERRAHDRVDSGKLDAKSGQRDGGHFYQLSQEAERRPPLYVHNYSGAQQCSQDHLGVAEHSCGGFAVERRLLSRQSISFRNQS